MVSAGEQVSTIVKHLDDGSGLIPRLQFEKLLRRLANGALSDTELELLLTSLDPGNTGTIHANTIKKLLYPHFRTLSLPKSVANAGGIDAWNTASDDLDAMGKTLTAMCRPKNVPEALAQVKSIMSLGHMLWAYAYMRKLYNFNAHLYYATIRSAPALLLPAVYTPTVGEACQKFGKMPQYPRGCYISITERGRVKEVLQEYAEAELGKDADGKLLCDCIVFSDAGRILGLGDLSAWGMGIPIGKLDLYTVCAGVNPFRTVPVILDAGCTGAEGNTDKLVIRDHPLYTGLKQPRVTEKSKAGTVVNSAYYGDGNFISEFMTAASELFGRECLLQFEDFNSNDAFPLLAEYRDKFLTYNDDIQGTAAVAIAAIIGGIKIRNPQATNLRSLLKGEKFFFHGSGSANLGAMMLLHEEAGVPKSNLCCTNSRGIVWRSEDGSKGSFRNDEQKAFAQVGEPSYDSKDLVKLIENVKPTVMIGAVGVSPGCFNKDVIEAVVRVNGASRPIVFALSNPKTQAEITASDAYEWSNGKVIYGSGTMFPNVELGGKTFSPGQVNNVYVFPGASFGAICCQATNIPESFFMAAAEAVANSLDDEDVKLDSVVPRRDRIAEVSLNVATAVVVEAQAKGLAKRVLGKDNSEVKAALQKMQWTPDEAAFK